MYIHTYIHVIQIKLVSWWIFIYILNIVHSVHVFIFIDQQVLALIQRHVSVLAFISGHDHDGGYAIDRAGIHHIIPPAPVEVCMYVCMFYYCCTILFFLGCKALLWDISTYILFYQSYNTSSACIYVCIHVCIYVCICTYCMYGSRTFVLESYKTFMD